MSPALSIGVIGVGVIGNAHIRAYMSQKNVEVVAVADVNREALKSVSERFGIEEAFTDYRDLLRLDEVEAVSVCTPPFNHARITCDAASAGKHILCEKPMAMNSREAEAMVQASRAAGVVLGVCSARSRFSPHVELAERYLSEGRLGKVYYVRFSRFRRRGRPGIDALKASKWFIDSRKAGGRCHSQFTAEINFSISACLSEELTPDLP
jgi:predicted dehydrogenase